DLLGRQVGRGVALFRPGILPGRFVGGLVGSFCFALVGSALVGFAISGFQVPGNSDVTIMTALEGIPGALLGMGLAYLIGVRRGNPALDL
ncbi:MAG: hypothetical protein ACKOTA_11835, partial [Solirubrobacterales bacterium]